MESSPVSNVDDLLDEAYLISLSAISGKEFTITPTYKIEESKRIFKKQNVYIRSIDKEFSLPGYNLMSRELLAHRIAEALADNSVTEYFKEENEKATLTGCRIFWKHYGNNYYLMDNNLDHRWEVAGNGDFALNRIHGKNEVQLEDSENTNMKDVHKIF